MKRKDILPDEMRLQDFCRTFGYSRQRMVEALHSEYKNQVGYQRKPGTNSPWIIYVERTRKLLKEKWI